MKNLVFALALFCCPSIAHKNQVVVMMVGNFNPTNYIYLTGYSPVAQPVISSNRSSFGGGVEYDRWLTPHVAVGPIFEMNPSDGKLLPTEENVVPGTGLTYYIWPLMRYEMGLLATEQASFGKWSPFIREGGGFIVTDSLVENSGWSHNAGAFAGFGIDYAVNERWSVRVGEGIVTASGGCYNGIRCNEDWGTAQDLEIGVELKW